MLSSLIIRFQFTRPMVNMIRFRCTLRMLLLLIWVTFGAIMVLLLLMVIRVKLIKFRFTRSRLLIRVVKMLVR